MATKHNDTCFHKAEDDEPLFTLLARDPIAPVLVRLWAAIRKQRQGRQLTEQELEAIKCAADMEEWRSVNRPDKERVTSREVEQALVNLGLFQSYKVIKP